MTQIFIEPELEALHDNAEEWNQLCTDLGLEIQLTRSGKIEKVGNPYMKVDPRSERVYEMLCPVKVGYKDYAATTLPLEVLQELKRCEDNKWFYKIEVWYDDRSPDPFAIGVETKEWNSPKFLIARWGDELLPFEQLIAKAIARFRNAYNKALEALILDCEMRKKDVDGDIQQYIDLGDGWNGFDFPKFKSPIR